MPRSNPTDPIARNLRSLCESSQLSIPQIASLAGVSERTLRTHLQSSDSAKVATLADYATVLDVAIDQLLIPASQPARRQYLVGHPPLDRVVRSVIQAERNPTARTIANQYIHPSYICTTSRYSGNKKYHIPYYVDSENLPVHNNIARNTPTIGLLYGITWETECRMNYHLVEDNKITIDRALIVGNHQIMVIQDSVETATNYRSRILVETSKLNTKSIIQLYFKDNIRQSVEDEATYPWLVIRKHWERIELTQTMESQTISPA